MLLQLIPATLPSAAFLTCEEVFKDGAKSKSELFAFRSHIQKIFPGETDFVRASEERLWLGWDLSKEECVFQPGKGGPYA